MGELRQLSGGREVRSAGTPPSGRGDGRDAPRRARGNDTRLDHRRGDGVPSRPHRAGRSALREDLLGRRKLFWRARVTLRQTGRMSPPASISAKQKCQRDSGTRLGQPLVRIVSSNSSRNRSAGSAGTTARPGWSRLQAADDRVEVDHRFQRAVRTRQIEGRQKLDLRPANPHGRHGCRPEAIGQPPVAQHGQHLARMGEPGRRRGEWRASGGHHFAAARRDGRARSARAGPGPNSRAVIDGDGAPRGPSRTGPAG